MESQTKPRINPALLLDNFYVKRPSESKGAEPKSVVTLRASLNKPRQVIHAAKSQKQ